MSIQSDSNFLGGPGFGGGFGGLGGNGIGAVGLIGLNTLFDRGDRRHDGDGGNCNESIFAATTLSKLGSIEGSIPLAALGTQNAILEQTNALGNTINQANLSQLMASSAVKDSVQNSAAAALINANNNTQAILGAICGLGSKIDANTITDLQTQLLRAESNGRNRETEVNITQSVNQNQSQLQAQAQTQAQFSALFAGLNALVGDIQAVKQGQVIFNSGTMAASGTQAAAATKVA